MCRDVSGSVTGCLQAGLPLFTASTAPGPAPRPLRSPAGPAHSNVVAAGPVIALPSPPSMKRARRTARRAGQRPRLLSTGHDLTPSPAVSVPHGPARHVPVDLPAQPSRRGHTPPQPPVHTPAGPPSSTRVCPPQPHNQGAYRSCYLQEAARLATIEGRSHLDTIEWSWPPRWSSLSPQGRVARPVDLVGTHGRG